MATNSLLNHLQRQVTPWSGKILGLSIGFLAAGSYGAMLGILLGNVIDKLLFGWLFHPHWKTFRHANDTTRRLVIESLYQLMGYLAKTDGYVTEQNIHFARKLMRQMRLHGLQKQLAMKSFNRGKEKNFNLNQTLNMATQACCHNHELKNIFTSALHSSCKQKYLSANVKQRLNLIYMRLGFKPPYPLHANSSDYSAYLLPDDDYQLLGIAPGCSKDEIKNAFRKKIKTIHPEKLIARGATEEEIHTANEKTKALQGAYRRIKAQL